MTRRGTKRANGEGTRTSAAAQIEALGSDTTRSATSRERASEVAGRGRRVSLYANFARRMEAAGPKVAFRSNVTSRKAKQTAKRAVRVATSRTPRKVRRQDTALDEYRRKRDFSKTAEPEGRRRSVARRKPALAFVIQKHAATRLHFDLRLELDGVMKSWAVPKGPSLDPSEKRLAMQVEDHPIEYNTFEGIIPKGEYGGGSVMLWDRGTYTYPEKTDDPVQRLRDGYQRGDFKFELHGKRLRGSWVLVRLRRGDPEKPAWLLIKHRDEYARPGYDIVAAEPTSVRSRRTMEQIAKGRSRVWNSNR